VGFGPKLDQYLEVPANGETVATLLFEPPTDTDWDQEGEIYAEDLQGLAILKISVHCTLQQATVDQTTVSHVDR
jgi:hypothetical protein